MTFLFNVMQRHLCIYKHYVYIDMEINIDSLECRILYSETEANKIMKRSPNREIFLVILNSTKSFIKIRCLYYRPVSQ